MLAERFKVTNRVGHFKADHCMPSKDRTREAAQFQRMDAISLQYGLDPEFARSYLPAVIARMIENHDQVASNT
jgi:chorismate mutase